MNNKPKVFKAIAIAVLGILLFYFSYIIAYLIIGGAIQFLSAIPLIGTLLGWFFSLRGDTPDMMLSLVIPAISYFVVMLVQEKINKHDLTRGLSCKILGICLIVLNALSLVLNLLYGEGILKNIIQIITGVVFYSSGKNILEENAESECNEHRF